MAIQDLHKCVRKVVRIVSVLIIFFAIINIIFPKKEPPRTFSILTPDSTRFLSLSERSERVKYLSEIILQHQSVKAQEQMTNGSERMQTRLSFIALFAVLLWPFFSSKSRKARIAFVCTAFIFFLSFYIYDIHRADLDSRQIHNKGCLDETILALSKISPTDSICYDLDYDRLNAWNDRMHARSKFRKICNFFRPDFSQISFYFIPFIVLLGLYLCFPFPKHK